MSEDYISRKAVIDYFFRPYSNEETYTNVDIEKIINNLPSVQPIRHKGEWISYHFGTFYVCSCCNERNNRRDNFCPNCGVDMRGTE